MLGKEFFFLPYYTKVNKTSGRYPFLKLKAFAALHIILNAFLQFCIIVTHGSVRDLLLIKNISN